MVMENMIISSNKKMIGAITLHCGNFHLNLLLRGGAQCAPPAVFMRLILIGGIKGWPKSLTFPAYKACENLLDQKPTENILELLLELLFRSLKMTFLLFLGVFGGSKGFKCVHNIKEY